MEIHRCCTASGRYALLNGNSASNRHTPLPLESDCHEYLETISVLLATLGKPVLQPLTASPTSAPDQMPPTLGKLPLSLAPGTAASPPPGSLDLRLELRQQGCRAKGVLSSEGLIVLAGSIGKARDRPSIKPGIKRIRERLISQGIASTDGNNFVMNRDHLFSSPSYAAGALVGGAENGRTAWKDAAGRTLKEIEEQQIGDDIDVTG